MWFAMGLSWGLFYQCREGKGGDAKHILFDEWWCLLVNVLEVRLTLFQGHLSGGALCAGVLSLLVMLILIAVLTDIYLSYVVNVSLHQS